MRVTSTEEHSGIATFRVYATNEEEGAAIHAVATHMTPGQRMDYQGRQGNLHGTEHLQLMFYLNQGEVIPLDTMFTLDAYEKLEAQVARLVIVASDNKSERVVRTMRDILYYHAYLLYVGVHNTDKGPTLELRTDRTV